MLTDAQRREAERLYIEERLTPADRSVALAVREAKERIEAGQAALKTAQKLCGHPLIAREYKNRGVTGHWDGYEDYWTDHHCTICDLRWRTDQRWQHRGDKHGGPKD